jgi:hypothetical protein
LSDVAGRFFSAEQAKRLLHNSLLPATITCYVSTQFGVGFEYSSAAETKIKTVRGSARVEDLFVQSPPRLREIGTHFNISAPDCVLGNFTLTGWFPFRLSREEASVTFWGMRFKSEALKWTRYVEYAEIFGDRRASRWSLEAAQNRAKDEVLAALFQSQRAEKANKKIEEYVSSFREKMVLLLGTYDSVGESRLRSIATCLEELGYDPVLVKDIPDFEHYDLTQKVNVIGGVSRFIIIDDTSPSGHLTEFEVCRSNRWVTLLLRANGIHSTWMTAGASIASNVILEASYDPSNPKPAVEESTKWAEKCLSELEKKFNALYPWRMES